MSPRDSGGIQRQTSSLSSSSSRHLAAPPQKNRPPEDEIIPDSEEERINQERARKDGISTDVDSDPLEALPSPTKRLRIAEPSVIIISSDSEAETIPRNPSRPGSQQPDSGDPFLEGSSGKSGGATTRRRRTPAYNAPKPPQDKGKGLARTHGIPRIESESEDDSDVICISDTDSVQHLPGPSASPVKQKIIQRTPMPYEPIITHYDPDINSNDSAILTFDQNVPRKPVLRTPAAKSKTPMRSQGSPAPASTPAPAPTPSQSVSPKKRKAVPPEQMRLEVYARTLFDELNASVFQGEMPVGTQLVWNVRLSTTAGRAFWSSNRHGETTSKIELSPKVVDCDERVRHTLAHEMCHLAVWVLDGDPSEQGHGPQFKAWARRVEKARTDITISTKHTYDINYKYQWECVECGMVYGRHSDSLNVETYGCGACKRNPAGRLKPLFEKRKRRTPKAVSGSKLASGSPRASPRSLDRPPRSPTKSPTKSTLTTPVPVRPGPNSDMTDEEDEVEELIKGLGSINMKT